jgi:flagellar biosynthesis protein FlhA
MEAAENLTLTARLKRLLSGSDLLMTFGLFGTVFLLILPIPSFFLDMFLAMSIGISLLILLLVLYVKDPPEFSVFPTILLAVTLFRLGLNVASTRLILLDGFAGNVIQSFGDFVVRGNYIVGIVVFLILVVINFVVITKGSGRIAEVAARFTLDSMPGKQMSIDAELNAGSIDEIEANRRRMKVQRDADFYGAMDGASKFVRGDAVAGILITLINIVGGILVGVFMKEMTVGESVEKYMLLSIGDGLVSQIPSLIISVGAGILITRSNESSNLGTFIGEQMMSYPRALGNLSGMMLIMGILPGMPLIPFFMLGGLSGFTAYKLAKKKDEEAAEVELQKKNAAAARLKGGSEDGKGSGGSSRKGESDMETLLAVDAFTMELGYGLLPLADRNRENDLISRITGVRKTFAKELGTIIPPIAIRDNLELETNEYRFLLRNKEIARGTLVPNRWMAMNVSNSGVHLKGIPTVEPVFGLEAVWILDDEKKTAEVHGFTVVDAASVLITHLQETLRDNAALLLEREDVQKLVDMVKERNPTLVSELLPDLVNIGIIHRVLQNLLREKVPVRNITLILESIGDYAGFTKNPMELAELVRRNMGTFFVPEYESEPGIINAMTLDPRVEQQLVNRVKRSQYDVNLMIDPQLAQTLISQLSIRIDEMINQGLNPILITSAEVRLAFKRFFDPSFPRLSVLSYQEIPNQIQIKNFGALTAPIAELGMNRHQDPAALAAS